MFLLCVSYAADGGADRLLFPANVTLYASICKVIAGVVHSRHIYSDVPAAHAEAEIETAEVVRGRFCALARKQHGLCVYIYIYIFI
jgi:hypothetical protein